MEPEGSSPHSQAYIYIYIYIYIIVPINIFSMGLMDREMLTPFLVKICGYVIVGVLCAVCWYM